jgi:hypothetical protein
MPHSRHNPSARYRELLALYTQMHRDGSLVKHPDDNETGLVEITAGETYPGRSLFPQAHKIKRLVERTNADTILDYGCGKGLQYNPQLVKVQDRVFDSILDYWEVLSVHCYDPAYPKFNALPVGKFDGVICTDVLEHCPEEDMEWIIGELFAYAERFVFANVACYPARAHLPTGENAHCTVREVAWWQDLIERTAAQHPQVSWEVWLQYPATTADGQQVLRELTIGNAK